MNRRQQDIQERVVDQDQLGVSRVQQIEWSHASMRGLSDAARLIYACLVDGCSSTAKETIDSVELVWRNRYMARARYAERDMRRALDEICVAVEELIGAGLLVMLDDTSVRRAWIMRPWESMAS